MILEKKRQEYLKELHESIKNVDAQMVAIKTALHQLQRIGINTKDAYKQVENVGIELYKLKQEETKVFLKDFEK